jgi:hypothetical protein
VGRQKIPKNSENLEVDPAARAGYDGVMSKTERRVREQRALKRLVRRMGWNWPKSKQDSKQK